MRNILALIVCAALLAGCFLTPHKIDVQQGNYLDQNMVAKLKLDMTRSQVRFIMGSPLLADPFHPERWDYVYIEYKGGTLKQERRLTLIFEGDLLKRALSNFPCRSSARLQTRRPPRRADVVTIATDMTIQQVAVAGSSVGWAAFAPRRSSRHWTSGCTRR
jgi:outer membrane protein assembly factor BamE